MSNQVLKVTEEELKRMEKYYGNNMVASPPGSRFRVKTDSAVITAYNSGKVLFQGKDAAIEAAKWKTGEVKQLKITDSNGSPYTPKESLFFHSHIGSDEAGTGDYFGPITVAAVFIEESKIPLLKKLGIRDSKTLTDSAIKRLAKKIIEAEIPYASLVLPNEKYNKLQQSGWSQGKMKALMHHHAIEYVKKKITNQQYDGIIIDQFCQPDVYKRYLRSENLTLQEKTFFVTKAESKSIAVAAASLLARTKFVDEMDRLSRVVGLELPKGAGQQVDKTIARFIQIYGREKLTTCAKIHFANTQKADKYL